MSQHQFEYEKGWRLGITSIALFYFKEDTDESNDLLCYVSSLIISVYDAPDNDADPIFNEKHEHLFADWKNPTEDERIMFEMEFNIPCYTRSDIEKIL